MKTIFDRITVFVFFLVCSFSVQGQDGPTREIGIRLSDFNDFGIIYKKQKANGKFRRIRLANTFLTFNSNQGQRNFNLSAAMAVGVEKRRSLGKRLQLINGLEFSSSLGFSTNGNSVNLDLTPGVGFVLGVQYEVFKRFLVSLETIPSLRVNFGIDENGFQDRIGVNAGFSSQAAALSLVYQFQSKKN